MDLLVFAIVVLGSMGLVLFFVQRYAAEKEESGKPTGKKQKDLSQEKASAKPLARMKRFAALYQYAVIAPANLAKNGVFADIDAIVVGAFGVLCVKCIGLDGELYGDANEESWLQIINGTRKNFANPIKKAQADTRLVRDALFAAKLKSVQVETICVFTNDKAQLMVPRNTGHYSVKEFSALMGKSKYEQDKGVNVAAAADAIRAYLAPQA